MKVYNYIYDEFNERGMKAFESRVSKFLKSKGLSGEAVCLAAWMERASGRGSYNKIAEIEVNDCRYKLVSHTNDSMLWDALEDTPKEKRALFEAVLAEEIDTLLESIRDDE